MIKMKDWKPVKGELFTRWTEDVDPECPLPEHPRPQMFRKEWLNLNGLWDYVVLPKKTEMARSYEGEILVPFPIESALSGVKKRINHKERIWYRRCFKVPNNWREKQVLLHFGAVDWRCEVWVNGGRIASHQGGYVPFSLDISNPIKFGEKNELIVSVWDPTDKKGYPRGKQKRKAYGIWYTPSSGIWQTVWMEPVPFNYIENIEITSDIDTGVLKVKVKVKVKVKQMNADKDFKYLIQVSEENKKIVEATGKISEEIELKIPNPKLWSPDKPFLYDLVIKLIHDDDVIDEVQSYAGMRKISIKKDESGDPRLALNDEILFQYGPLDQGYWPDGIYTAPTDDALKHDIEITKELGFNMIRKHVKVEPARWYYWCDKLGMLVWQDMPTGGKTGLLRMAYGLLKSKKRKDYYRPNHEKKAFYDELRAMILSFYNHPSIVVWVPFNEGWGQFETAKTLEFVRKLDSTRLVDLASGWFDHQIGDIADCHKYVGPAFPKNVEGRVPVCGEFGGLGLKVEGHTWNKKLKFVYKKFKSSGEVFQFYSQLIEKLKELKKQGLSAAVYTQTTDVEGEINGLLTYDREIIKMDMEKQKQLNSSLY